VPGIKSLHKPIHTTARPNLSNDGMFHPDDDADDFPDDVEPAAQHD
jgi:hypothetical protein